MPASLTGSTAAKAKASALTAVPGTVEHASKARRSGPGGKSLRAAYAVFVKDTAGGRYIVLEDASFKVLSKAKATGLRGGPGGSGSPGMGSGPPPAATTKQ